MRLCVRLEDGEIEQVTNFDIAREVVRLCENGHFDIQTVLKMIQAQVECNNKF